MISGTITVQKHTKEHELLDGRSNVLNEYFFRFCQGLASFVVLYLASQSFATDRQKDIVWLYREFFCSRKYNHLTHTSLHTSCRSDELCEVQFQFPKLIRCLGLCNCTLQTATIREWHSEQCGFLVLRVSISSTVRSAFILFVRK